MMAKIKFSGFEVTPEELEKVKGLATSMICGNYKGGLLLFKIKKDHVLASIMENGNWWISFPHIDNKELLFLHLAAALEEKR